MWLLIFPEGTNLSATTRQKSASWAKKSGLTDMKHQLLPRSTGLQFCLQELKQTTNWLYDCTIAYEGIPTGQYGQDIFTLRSSFFEGRPPKSVNMYWRRFKISDIPVDNDEAFARWLNNRWREKDYILEYFYKYNKFPAEEPTKALAAAEGKRPPSHARMIGTEVKGGGWDEFLSIFGPITTAAGALSNVDMTGPIDFDALLTEVAKSQQLNLMNLGKEPLTAATQQYVRNALKAAQRTKAIPQPVLNYLIKEPPQTQEQMQKAIETSANKTGNTQIAKKAQQAPAEKKAVPTQTNQEVMKAAQQAKQVIAKGMTQKPNIPNPRAGLQKAMPMANTEAVLTRPLTTMAVQSAAATVRNTAAQNTKNLGAGTPGQTTAARKAPVTVNGVKQPPGAPKASSVASTSASKRQPVKLNTVQRKVPTTGSKPIGTQKYATGMKT